MEARTISIFWSVAWAIIGALIINILPYINLGDLEKSTLPPLKKASFTFSLIFLVLLGGIVDLLYCLDGEIPKYWNSALTGAAAPAIITNLLRSFVKNEPKPPTNDVG